MYRLHTCICFLRFDSILTVGEHILNCTIKCFLFFQHRDTFWSVDMVTWKVWVEMWIDLMGRCEALQIQAREPIKSIRTASNFIKQPWLEMTKDTVHIKNMQSNKMNIIQHTAWTFYRKYSDITPFVIINTFMSNCDLTTHSVLVTVPDYNHIYFKNKLSNFITCN